MPQFIQKPKECQGCPLEDIGEGFILPEGNGSTPLLLTGESPGYNEILEGLPFRPSAQAGSILHRVIREKAKHTRGQLTFNNLCMCRPPQDHLLGMGWEYEAVNHCKVHFDRVVNKFKPKVILALGAVPFKHLTGLEGHNLNINMVRGYVFASSRYPSTLVVPTFHPSYIRRGNAHLMGILLFDYLKAFGIAQGTSPEFIMNPMEDKSLKYILSPSYEAAVGLWQHLKGNPLTLVSIDIETKESIGKEEDEIDDYGEYIKQVQLSIAPSSGIAFPWEEPFISIFKKIMSLPNPKVGHNFWDFDRPILQKAGVVINGRVDDTMWMMHHYQSDIPIGLQATASYFNFPFPWKHLSGQSLAFYGIADTDAPLRIMEHLPKRLKDRDLWRGYEELVYKVKPILIKTQDRGYPVNQKKQEVFKEAIHLRKGEIEGELKERVSSQFNRYHPEEGYKNVPADLKVQLILAATKMGVGVETLFTNPLEEVAEGAGLGVVGFKQGSCGFCRQNGEIKGSDGVFMVCPACQGRGFRTVRRYCKVIPFNPNSPPQVSDLIKYKKHEKIAAKLAINIAKESRSKIDLHDFEDEEKDLSTSKGVLKGLAIKTGDKVYSLMVEYRELTKMEGSFLGGGKNGKKGWKPGEDGRVHTTFTFRPPTVQTSSRDPNIQQGPVHSTLAIKFNETIEAKEGHVLTKLDYKSYHALMLGFLAEDPDYIRLARLDIHSYVTAHMVSLPEADVAIGWEDEKLRGWLKEVKGAYKSLRDDQAKHAILGIGFGLSEEGCYERYKEDFNPKMEEVLKGWGKKRSNPLEVDLRTGMARWQVEAEAQGKKKVKKLYELLRRLFPRVFKFQDKIIALADNQNYIDIPFGFRRWFWAAGEPRYDKWGNVLSIKKGEQAQQAMAYPVAANAFCHMRENLRILEDGGEVLSMIGGSLQPYLSTPGLLDKARLVNMVHDDFRFEPREEEWEEVMKKVLTVMRRRSKVLVNWTMPEGFHCEVDIKVGHNLAEMKEVSL